MEPAKVTVVSPLEVRLNTSPSGSSTPVQRVSSEVPALSVGDDVLVAVIERRLHVLHKVVAA